MGTAGEVLIHNGRANPGVQGAEYAQIADRGARGYGGPWPREDDDRTKEVFGDRVGGGGLVDGGEGDFGDDVSGNKKNSVSRVMRVVVCCL